jgi:SAM-dependent methyltransferase
VSTPETTPYVVRTEVTFVRERGALLCVAPGSAPIRFDGDSAEFARAAVAHLAEAQSSSSLRARLEQAAGGAIDEALVTGLVSALHRAGVIAPPPQGPKPERPKLSGVNVVLGVTGAIAAIDAPRLALALLRAGASVRVATSRAAGRFVSRTALEAITHAPVASRLYSRDPAHPVPHIELAQWADVVVIAPATATTLGRVAAGDCSDVLSALCIATKAPLLFVPSMNEDMWSAPATERNVATLLDDGQAMVDPHYGVEVANKPKERRPRLGGMPSPESIVRTLIAWLMSRKPELLREAADWDALYRDPGALPWAREGLDEVVHAALKQHAPPPQRLLDLGCGLGAQARAASRLGYSVVGVDGSAAAVARAAASGGGPVFLKGDLLQLDLHGEFDVLLDRGTLHTLRASQLDLYAATLTRLSREGALLIVVHDGPAASPSAQTLKLGPEELAARLPAFDRLESLPMTLREGEVDAALCTVFRRRVVGSAEVAPTT